MNKKEIYSIGDIKDIERVEIKEGIYLTLIDTKKKFNVNSLEISFLKEETKDLFKLAMIAYILETVNSKYTKRKEVEEKLDNMYGAVVNFGIINSSRNDGIESSIKVIRNDFALEGEDILKEALDYLFVQTFEPLIEDGGLSEKHFKITKNNIIEIMESFDDDKTRYANSRFNEEFFKGEIYAENSGKSYMSKVGDAKKLTAKDLYELYKEILAESKVNIYITGDISEKRDEIIDYIINNEHIKSLEARKPKYNEFDFENIDKINDKRAVDKVNEIIEEKEVSQAQLRMGYLVSGFNKKDKAAIYIFNTIFGGTTNSRLFRIVREKHSLAYFIGSNLNKVFGTISIYTGIEEHNYEKTVKIINEILDGMQNGDITDEELELAKNVSIINLKSIDDNLGLIRETISYKENIDPEYSVESVISEIKNVTKEDVVSLAKRVKLQLIYCLKNNDAEKEDIEVKEEETEDKQEYKTEYK